MRTLTILAIPFLFLCNSVKAQPNVRTVTLNGQLITYEVRGERAIVEGDIILGNVADIEAAAQAEADGNTKDRAAVRSAVLALTSTGAAPLWPNGVLYYAIDSTVINTRRIEDAIAYWNTRTPLKIVPRVAETDYVRFWGTPGVCSSSAGRVGGLQFIDLDEGCSTDAVIHEIGHAFGLLHEQSRQDRNTRLTVLYENIDSVTYSQFNQFRPARDVGFYDFDSTMHYPTLAFSWNGKNTQETVPPGIPVGRRAGLSPGDIDNISRIYGFIPTRTTVTTVPEGLSILVDGEQFTSPRSFEWAPGTTHQIQVSENQSARIGGIDSRFRFARWTDGGASTHTFTASAEQTVVSAEFQQFIRLTAVAAPGGSVSVQPTSPDGYYLLGTEVRISTTPQKDWKFLAWTGDSVQNLGFGTGATTLTFELNNPLSIVGHFTIEPMTTVDSLPSGRFVTVDGVGMRTPARFVWTPGTQHSLNVPAPQFTPSQTTRFRFAGWEDGASLGQRSVTATATDATYAVRFQQGHYLNFARSGSGSLAVSPGQDSTYIDNGLSIQLRAIPITNQVVQYWLGDVSGVGAAKDIVMDRPRRALVMMGSALPFRPVNAASYLANPAFDSPGFGIAPLQIMTVFGTNVGPAELTSGQLDGQGRLGVAAGNTRILINGIPAPMLYASATQTSVIVPKEVATGTIASVSVERNGAIVPPSLLISVTPTLPGIFTADSSGSGPIVALNADGTRNAKDRPAEAGSWVTFIATGAGLLDRDFANGEITSTLSSPRAGVLVRVGKEPAEVYYAGAAPGLVNGAIQVNARIPANLPTGEWPIRVIMGNAASPPGTTIFVK